MERGGISRGESVGQNQCRLNNKRVEKEISSSGHDSKKARWD